ncbi:site-specific integrase [Duncaniella freteri]|uniref:site-specific integrase n=1 Tax=Duncaniella freteri TaxID=2530391 RepID=UPI002573161E|nr:site-specific integrase [Duncaniella freteri]
MIAIKRSISFGVEVKKKPEADNKKNQKSEGRVRCVIVWHGQRVRLSVNHNVNPDNWEKSVQRCKAKTTHGKNKTPASVINKDLQEMEDLINSIFMRFEEAGRIPTKEEFSEAYDRQVNPEKYVEKDKIVNPADEPLFKIYDKFIKDGMTSGRWSEGTLVKCRTIRKHLYSISRKLSLNDIINGGINILIEHFAKVPDNFKQKGLANTTIKNDIAFVKVFLRWAQEHGYCDASPFLYQKVKLKTAEKPVIFLTKEELMKVYDFDFGHKNYLSQVRDVFCFCCFTSLRYSDVYNLRRSNITDSEIHITTIKTHDTLTIELNRYSRAILDKYADIPFPDDKALPVITNQKMNDYLKEMGKVCGIDTPITITRYKGTQRYDKTYKKYELLSTHCARRTFVCNAIMLGIPTNIVMKWTGHSDYATMKPYLDIADETRRSAMTAFNRFEDFMFPSDDRTKNNGGAESGAEN